MARRFRRRTRSAGRTLIAKRWSGELLVAEASRAAGGTDATTILAPVDYEQSSTMEPGGVTLARIRGSLTLRATVVGGLAYCGIYVVSELSPVNNPVTFAGMIDGNCLWHRMLTISTVEPLVLEVDVRAKRKLRDDQVVFAISAVAQTVIYCFSFKCLLLGG